METPNQDAPELLCEEILAEAQRESGQIVGRAREQAKALLAEAAAEAQQARQERLAQARTEAARRTELILATVPVEAGRLRAARVEALLLRIHDEARQRLVSRDHFDYRQTVVTLAAEAMKRMAGAAFVVKLAPADRAELGEGLAGEITLRVGRSALSITVADAPGSTESGLTVQDPEGRQVWDNRLLSRLERLWPELRRQVAAGAALLPGGGPAGGSV